MNFPKSSRVPLYENGRLNRTKSDEMVSWMKKTAWKQELWSLLLNLVEIYKILSQTILKWTQRLDSFIQKLNRHIWLHMVY